MDYMKKKFFPNNESQKGPIVYFETSFWNKKTGDIYNLEESLSDFKRSNDLKDLKFSLRTKKKSRMDILEIRNKHHYDSDTSFDSDFESPYKRKKPRDDVIDLSDDSMDSTPNFSNKDMLSSTQRDQNTINNQTSGLIGSNHERVILRQQQQREYEESLEIDRLKQEQERQKQLEERQTEEVERKRQTEENERKRQEEEAEKQKQEEAAQMLHEARKARVGPEINDLSLPHTTIIVRHSTLGPKSRLFQSTGSFQQVYDWIGSLALYPQHFNILSYDGKIVPPHTELASGSYNMFLRNEPIPMSPSGTVAFKGFASNIIHEQIEDDTEEVVTKEVVTKEISTVYNHLEAVCQSICPKEIKDIEVSRENIYEEFLTIYRRRNITKYKLDIAFKDEKADGNGISRDAYSGFFEKAFSRWQGASFKTPSVQIEDEELSLFGKIFTHAFITYNIFPLSLSKVTLKHYLGFPVTDAELKESFLRNDRFEGAKRPNRECSILSLDLRVA